ncbi:hypothetical protein EDD11_002674 [Mortierella claussenii]|nr:hypothetical protein EDD11_002674 [Mortierella claussenii]
MKISALSLVAAVVAPALAAQTWDVNIVNGMFSPQELTISPGDSVRWPLNDGPDHAIVQTEAGNRTCTPLAGGFNSGTKTNGQAYIRTFPGAETVNYKDGIGANCLKGATGTIFVGTQPSSTSAGGQPTSTSTSTSTGTQSSATSTVTQTFTTSSGTRPTTTSTSAPITSPTNKPNSANSHFTPEKSILLGVACFIGALAL